MSRGGRCRQRRVDGERTGVTETISFPNTRNVLKIVGTELPRSRWLLVPASSANSCSYRKQATDLTAKAIIRSRGNGVSQIQQVFARAGMRRAFEHLLATDAF